MRGSRCALLASSVAAAAGRPVTAPVQARAGATATASKLSPRLEAIEVARRDGQDRLGHRQVNRTGPDRQPLDPLHQRWIELVGAVEHAGEQLRDVGVSTHGGEAPGQLQRNFGPLLRAARRTRAPPDTR